MVAFEVLVNGERVATAGVGDLGILLAIVRWVRRTTDACTIRLETISDVEVCGQSFVPDEYLIWADRPLKVGDEVLVRIIEVEQVDEPTSKTPVRDIPFAGQDQRDT